MIYFVLIVIVLLIALRMIVRKPAVKVAKPAKAAKLTRKENSVMRSVDRMGW